MPLGKVLSDEIKLVIERVILKMQRIKSLLRSAYWIIGVQFGFDPIKAFRSFLGLPRYARDLLHFRSQFHGRLELKPCLFDWYEEGGISKSEYFWQDLLVARMIFSANPEKHVDIGSRVDGFVAHVASFREIEVLDIRPITTEVPGVTFKQADLMSPLGNLKGYCDSLSCLHALEHFGLGRYGDKIDVNGFVSGLANMAALVKKNGVFYLAVPIGIDRVEFNANRVFEPNVIIDVAKKNSLHLRSLTTIKHGGDVEEIAITGSAIDQLASQRYSLGIFVFVRNV